MFKGKWIAPQELWDNMHVVFSKTLCLDEAKKAKIRITADDYYILYINNKYIGQGPAPSYSFAYNFNEFDIALKKGENKIVVLVYYQGLENRVWESGNAAVGLIADVFDDEKIILSTDESWKYQLDESFTESESVGYETAFLENRDLRIPLSNEKTPCCVEYNYIFKAEPFPALQITEKTAEPKVTGNRYFYDFEQEYVCNIKIKAESDKAGKRIIIHCAEELDENEKLKFDMRCGCRYEERCILDKGENLIEQFDYKAFRYLEIIADEGVRLDAKILIRHYPFTDIEIKTKNKELESVLNLCKKTVLLGAQEVFIDCPTREKGQYLGDAFIREGAITKVLKVSRNNRYGILHFTTIIKNINIGGKCNEKIYY
ncbi:MAG: family 78 glycoside hydrolase catalytic domain [Eubacterium sp.]|nr:family 78 glycoside hydrolase catalytic domain [Eubacterium sp.]